MDYSWFNSSMLQMYHLSILNSCSLTMIFPAKISGKDITFSSILKQIQKLSQNLIIAIFTFENCSTVNALVFSSVNGSIGLVTIDRLESRGLTNWNVHNVPHSNIPLEYSNPLIHYNRTKHAFDPFPYTTYSEERNNDQEVSEKSEVEVMINLEMRNCFPVSRHQKMSRHVITFHNDLRLGLTIFQSYFKPLVIMKRLWNEIIERSHAWST